MPNLKEQELREDIKVLLEENGLQWKFDFTELLLGKLATFIQAREQEAVEEIYNFVDNLEIDSLVPNIYYEDGWSDSKLKILTYLESLATEEKQEK